MRTSALVSAVIIGLLTCTASGTIISYELGFEISGGEVPDGPAPWLTATFDDEDTPGSVNLTLETTNLNADEFVGVWMFNLDPELKDYLGDLNFSLTKTGTFDDPTVSTGEDTYSAGGGGRFDIQIKFATRNGPLDHRFDRTVPNNGDCAMYEITGIASMTAASFDLVGAHNNPGKSLYKTIAHIQGIGSMGEDSSWIVPEPATLSLLWIGALTLITRRRR